MKIHIPKNNLSDALDTFGKMLSAKDKIAVRSDGKNAVLAGQGHEAALSMMLEAATATDSGACSVSFSAFKSAIDTTETKEIGLETQGNSMTVLGDGRRIASLPIHPDIPYPAPIPKEAENTPLPTGFASFLMQAFQSAGSVPKWESLAGVYISARGVAASDGNQLVSIPLPSIRLQGDVIMPPNPLYDALRKHRWSSLSIWDDKSEKRHFAIQGDGFLLTMDAMEGLYPQYWSILPDRSTLDVKTVLTADSRVTAIDFLSKVLKPDGFITEMWIFPDRIELSDRNDRMTSFPASTDGRKLPCGVFCNAKFILQALKLGHTTIQLNSSEPGVIVASGGSGMYAWMPFKDKPEPYPSTTCKSKAIATMTTTTKKENPKMTQTSSSPMNNRSAASTEQPQPVETTTSTTPADPLSELSATIASMKEYLDELQTRLLDAGRKLREATIQQKQKERVYQDTQKRLERIRMAV